MARAATVGALRVVLGADTAAFEKGLKRANTKLSGFAAAARRAGPVIGAAIGVAAVGLGVAIKNTIDQADALSKMSEKIGVPVEELSRLKHAAELSGVGFETLTKGIQRFSRNIVEADQGLKTPLRAFAALDIEIKKTDGSLKTVSDALPEIAERFARMRDGPEKTALAMQLFGRAGAELIPLLNEGAVGMEKLKAEADELGIVFDEKAAKAAEEFNDNLDRLQKIFDGALIGSVNEFTPVLLDLSEALLRAREELGKLVALKESFESLVGVDMSPFFESLRNAALISLPVVGQFVVAMKLLRSFRDDDVPLTESQEMKELDFDKLQRQIDAAKGAADEFVPKLNVLDEQTEAAKKSQDAYNEKLSEAQALLIGLQTPAEAYQAQLSHIEGLYKLGMLSADEYATAQQQAAENANATWGQASESIAGSFAQIGDAFAGESREMAIAAKAFGAVQALISVYTGAAKALELPPPANFAAMAAVLAQGLSFVSTIKSQSIPAFAHGGSFTVGGMGGVDNNLVSMRLGRGERVDVTPVGGGGADGGRIELAVRAVVDGRGNIVPIIESVSGSVAGRAVAAARPGIVEDATQSSLGAIGTNEGDAPLGSRFNLSPQAPSR